MLTYHFIPVTVFTVSANVGRIIWKSIAGSKRVKLLSGMFLWRGTVRQV